MALTRTRSSIDARRTLLACGLVVALSLFRAAIGVAQGPADVAQARELFFQGATELQAGNHARACELLGLSLQLVDRAPTRYNLSVCSGALGRVLDQAEHLRAYLRLVASETDPSLRAQGVALAPHIQQQLEVVTPRIPRLVLEIRAVPHLRVRINGYDLPSAAWSVPRPVNPGDVRIEAEAPDFLSFEESFRIEEGQERRVAIALEPSPASILTVPRETVGSGETDVTRTTARGDEADDSSGLSWQAWLGIGSGAVAIVAGAVILGFVLSDTEYVSPDLGDDLDVRGSVP